LQVRYALHVHIKGPLAGQFLTLEPWQSFILTCVFGWVWKHNGKRRFRRVYVEVPRGNGKTTISVVPALYCLAAEKEGGAEVYSAARIKDQAKIAFNLAQQMARKNPRFSPALALTFWLIELYIRVVLLFLKLFLLMRIR
jgi:phage terminase large subunit-like protein